MSTALWLASVPAYLAGWILAARFLFARWRPGREVVRCVRRKRNGGPCPDSDGGHGYECYRRRRKDLTQVAIDSDLEAVTYAAATALLWPLFLIWWAITARTPELEAERVKRLEREEKARKKALDAREAEIARLEKELRR